MIERNWMIHCYLKIYLNCFEMRMRTRRPKTMIGYYLKRLMKMKPNCCFEKMTMKLRNCFDLN
jgi:hypothetical protein